MDYTRKETTEYTGIDHEHKENMFKIRTDENGSKYYDLTDDIFIDIKSLNAITYSLYEVVLGDDPRVLSKRFYETDNLWWIILTFNNIDDPFDLGKMTGQIIKIPSKKTVGDILDAM